MTQLELILGAIGGVSVIVNFAFWRGNSCLEREYLNMRDKYDHKCKAVECLREDLQTKNKHYDYLKSAIGAYMGYVERVGHKPGTILPDSLTAPFIGIIRRPTVRPTPINTTRTFDKKANLSPCPEPTSARSDVPWMDQAYKDQLLAMDHQARRKYLYGDFDSDYLSPTVEEIKPYTGTTHTTTVNSHVGTCSTSHDTSHHSSHSTDTSSSSFSCDSGSSSSSDSGSCSSSCD